MTFYITSNQNKTFYVTLSNEEWVLDAGASINVANGHGMVNYAGYTGTTMTASGEIIADGFAKSGMYSEGAGASLKVDTSGTIHAYNGMSIYAEGDKVENLGKITAANLGIYANAHDVDILNHGTISAATGIYVENADSTKSNLENYGTITGANGIVAINGGMAINNHFGGLISATVTAVSFGENTKGPNTLVNYGVVHSDDVAISGSSGSDQITNWGTIEGRVVLGNGDDFFKNVDGGKIVGAVDGGLGNDIYGFGAGSFEIIDAGGSDTIISSISRSLVGYDVIENLILEGSGNVNATGNALSNIIYGNSGNNILNGGQDTLTDFLLGGAGNDIYVLGAGHDVVDDTAGIDTITSTISRTLADYAGIERLTLLGSGNISGTGNALANIITGNAGNNVLDGGVDSVVDTLKGGAGNDTYVLAGGHDTVVDTAGVDTITSTISRSLANYAAIENLTLLGNGNISGTGNALANVITGNAGNNILDGGLDSVVDTLKGGAGNDTYVLGAGSDTVVDTAGVDTITSTIGRSLANYATIENLTLLGSGNLTGIGNGLANVITGNAGANTLSGGAGGDTLFGGAGNDLLNGGVGNDVLAGGAGSDTFVFKAGDGKDTIVDFTDGADHIKLYGATWADVHMVDGAGGVTVTFDGVGDSLFLKGIDAAHLSTSDFIFA